ncbi:MAG TPA: 3-deoxy-manno-octulosonate cytidylyltransferase [Thermoleophilaceae bacterium]|nr:3-deoxy-manno-octulosonate cytidylyltransferase [Thermoleophilaceae bacterium]
MSAVVAIPARLQSSRLPRKLLLDVAGRPLIQRTHDVAVAADAGPVVVLTDSREIADRVEGFGGEAVMTAGDLDSGTARIASVAERFDTDVVVNLQGDAPLTDPEVVAAAARSAQDSGAPVTMAVYPLGRAADVADPNTVKVVRARNGRVVYCSRAPIPYIRDEPVPRALDSPLHWGHSGIYAYSRGFLDEFADISASQLEEAERLEQLRWLEAGIEVRWFEVEAQGPSVDTAADLQRVRVAFAEREQL